MSLLINQRVLLERVKARFKREIIQRITTEELHITSLTYGPLASELSFQSKKLYSKQTVVEIQHHRDGFIQGHLFQERRLFDVENVILDVVSGIFFTDGRKIVEESSSWPSLNLLLNSIPKPPKVNLLPNLQAPQVISISSNGFYHWLIEDLAPLIFAHNEFPDSTILVSENAPIYVKTFVEKYYSNIKFVPRFVHLEHYTFVSRGPDTEWVHPQDISTLRNFFASSMKRTIIDRKIYIPRVNSSRSPAFEKELVLKLIKAGWVILETQGLSLVEQIEAISSAETVCGVHGAGLAGMVWMAANTTVIELSPRNFVPCFSRLSAICNQSYFRIPYEDDELKNEDQIFSEIEAILSKESFSG